jgi:hypothetical protein
MSPLVLVVQVPPRPPGQRCPAPCWARRRRRFPLRRARPWPATASPWWRARSTTSSLSTSAPRTSGRRPSSAWTWCCASSMCASTASSSGPSRRGGPLALGHPQGLRRLRRRHDGQRAAGRGGEGRATSKTSDGCGGAGVSPGRRRGGRGGGGSAARGPAWGEGRVRLACRPQGACPIRGFHGAWAAPETGRAGAA